MAAAYSTGSATDPTDLLTKINTWLVAQGWTTDSFVTDGAGKRMHCHKGANYVNMRSAINEAPWPNLGGAAFYGIALYMSTAYSGANGWAAQVGGPVKSGGTDLVGASTRLTAGALTAYHLFDDGTDNITIVVERAGSLFTHMGFGVAFAKSGTWTGGPYFYGALAGMFGGTGVTVMGDSSNSAGAPGAYIAPFNINAGLSQGHALFVRVDVDTFTGKWVSCGAVSTVANEGYTGKLGGTGITYDSATVVGPVDYPSYGFLLTGHLVSAFNAQVLLLPVRVHAQRDAGGWSFLGEIPEVFCCRGVGNGWAAASIQSINGKNYMAFPNFAVRKRA